jgi:lysophospholipase L1-like esterase
MGAYAAHEDINYMLITYAAAAREVARETDATLLDTFSAFMGRPDGLKLIQDGCHPNVAGQALIAETLTPIVRQAMAGREANSTR